MKMQLEAIEIEPDFIPSDEALVIREKNDGDAKDIAALNRLPHGDRKLLASNESVVRLREDGFVCLMNDRESGWKHYFYMMYRGWKELLIEWNIAIVGVSSDEHGKYWIVRNRGE